MVGTTTSPTKLFDIQIAIIASHYAVLKDLEYNAPQRLWPNVDGLNSLYRKADSPAVIIPWLARWQVLSPPSEVMASTMFLLSRGLQ
jgi:hypothetical protein